MGLAERKERERSELRELILLTAKEIIIREGHDKLSIRKIAQEIEYSPATIYLYFKDKDEILYQMTCLGFSKLTEKMIDVFNINDPIHRIYQIGKIYINFGLEHKDWYDLMFNSPSPMKHIQRCQQEWGEGTAMFSFFTASCEQAINAQHLGINPSILALQLWSSVHGLVNIINTERLIVVSPEADQEEMKSKLIDETLDTTMFTVFNTRIS
jgi:AcrR family transcriptional regulator